jgi:DNA ligase 1
LPDLADGDAIQVAGSGSSIYTLKNVGGVYSCSCPAWRNQSLPIERRTCKHLRALRGDEAEKLRLGSAELAGKPARPRPATGSAASAGEPAESGHEPPLLLAHKWEMDIDLDGWWMSEKLDGVRAYWDGSCLLSRLGNRFFAPDWFLEGLPPSPLDGELWIGRKKFQRTVGIVRRQDRTDLWREVRYLVFDAPAHGGVFEERLEHLATALGERAPHAGVHPHEVCHGLDHLHAELARVEALGGEGLMLRRPRSRYEVGRSSSLLKVKSFHDAEARVIGHVPGAGRHAGRLGSLLVELPDGTRFNVGTGLSDAERESPPPLGAIVTFRYQELSDGGVPRFPSYVGVRDDVRFPPPASPARPAKARVEKRAPPTPAPASSPTSDHPLPSRVGARRFELVEGSSSKFWEIALDGASFTTRYGRIGSKGAVTLKEYTSPEKARAEGEKLIAEKLRKGYVEK